MGATKSFVNYNLRYIFLEFSMIFYEFRKEREKKEES
jgi:hypothetical protein